MPYAYPVSTNACYYYTCIDGNRPSLDWTKLIVQCQWRQSRTEVGSSAAAGMERSISALPGSSPDLFFFPVELLKSTPTFKTTLLVIPS